MNAPETASPAQDARPMYWVEVSKNGDTYCLCKEGHLETNAGRSIGHCFVPAKVCDEHLDAHTSRPGVCFSN